MRCAFLLMLNWCWIKQPGSHQYKTIILTYVAVKISQIIRSKFRIRKTPSATLLTHQLDKRRLKDERRNSRHPNQKHVWMQHSGYSEHLPKNPSDASVWFQPSEHLTINMLSAHRKDYREPQRFLVCLIFYSFEICCCCVSYCVFIFWANFLCAVCLCWVKAQSWTDLKDLEFEYHSKAFKWFYVHETEGFFLFGFLLPVELNNFHVIL